LHDLCYFTWQATRDPEEGIQSEWFPALLQWKHALYYPVVEICTLYATRNGRGRQGDVIDGMLLAVELLEPSFREDAAAIHFEPASRVANLDDRFGCDDSAL
jgi:hypothetical protein